MQSTTRLASASLALLLGSVIGLTQVPEAHCDDDLIAGVGEYGGPSRPLNATEYQRWLRGRAQYDRNFHKSDGLGSNFNGDSCRSCHGDPVMGGAGALELNVSRFGRNNGGAGPFTNLPDGQIVSRLRDPNVAGREECPDMADVFEQRQTPTTLGGGLIRSIPDATILAGEDPGDLDGDGITGVARLITLPDMSVVVGRLGWKAGVPTNGDFIRDAMGAECGITTPDDGRGFAKVSDADGVMDPELSAAEVGDLEFFMDNLAAPPRGGSIAPEVIAGEAIFSSVGCAKCHFPTLPGTGGPVPLFSDLLLHDIAQPGFLGMSDPGAPSGTYRTPPLWGLRDTPPYLHDGRAETIADAIEQHAGEASGVKADYDLLSTSDRDALLAFLADL